MNKDELDRFNEADKKIHPVETQWHFPIMTAAGFIPETTEGVGFVRSYVYTHPDGRKIRATTGVNGDYWNDMTVNKGGYWCDLKAYVKRV